MIDLFAEISSVYKITLQMLSFATFIHALEDLFGWSHYKRSGILSWNVFRTSSSLLLKKWLSILLSDTLFKSSFILRFCLSLCIFTLSFQSPFSPLMPYLLLTQILLLLLIGLRNAYGLDGAYHMTLVLLLGMLFGTAFPHSPIAICSLIFITVQLLLSYFISGVRKLLSKIWISGGALAGIFSTQCYGHPFLFRIFQQRPTLSRILSLGVILPETLFLVFFLGKPWAFALILWGILFHLSNAIFMGLNTFFFTFLSCYPALLYTFNLVRG